MRMQRSFILAIIITVILVLIFFLQNNNYTEKKEYSKLLPDLKNKVDYISKLEINDTKNSLYLLKKDNIWFLPSYNSYPASQKKINNFLLNIISLQTVDKKTSNPKNHKKLGLALPIEEASNRFRIFDDNKELLADFIIGKKSKQNEELSYIRNLASNETWLFKNNLEFYNTELDWAEESIIRIARWRIKSINVQSANKGDKRIFISKNKYSDQTYKLKDIPKKYELSSIYSISGYTSLLESLKKTDVKVFSDEYKVISKIDYQTFDGIIITINLYQVEDAIYSHFSISSDIKERKELSKEEPVIVGLPKMKSFNEIKLEVDKYSHVSKWLYKLNDDIYKEFLKPFSELIKKKEVNK